MTWVVENLATIIFALIVLLSVLLAIRSIYRNKRNGKFSCGGNCNSCSISCHEDPNLIEQYYQDRGK